MLFDTIKNKDNYKDFPKLFQALNFLSLLPENKMPKPNTTLIENELFCNPVTLITKPENECVFEAHKNFCDLHYIVEGTERIATADVTMLDTKIPYVSEKDIEFLIGPADGYYDLKPGQFMLCFPHDAHKVAIMVTEPENIKKIVFKIRKDN
ncbi:MAG: YhcH/YjgK/YiaL family protein [Suipraeoptans sp.]